MTRWSELRGAQSGDSYARRFAQLAAEGHDVHGEASFLAELIPSGARVVDAGCGTGRIALRLAELGYDCLGLDADESMLAVARTALPEPPAADGPAVGALSWALADLATLDPDALELDSAAARGSFGLAFTAGNVIPLLGPGTLDEVVVRLAALLEPDGLLVSGFGLDAAHLPARCPVTPLVEYERACAAAGLTHRQSFASWDARPFTSASGYSVSVHSRS
jgi:SAM-dependent methyltransferase